MVTHTQVRCRKFLAPGERASRSKFWQVSCSKDRRVPNLARVWTELPACCSVAGAPRRRFRARDIALLQIERVHMKSEILHSYRAA